ncbi:hypothetical protein BvCmsKKP041_03935 [Escherichia coli]|nr:hypothetical protein BvCmsKKP041_03935 [Escherichia coli]
MTIYITELMTGLLVIAGLFIVHRKPPARLGVPESFQL